MSPSGGGAGGKLADLFVQFSTAGVETITKAVEGIQSGLKKLADLAAEMGQQVQRSAESAGKALAGMTPAAALTRGLEAVNKGLGSLAAATQKVGAGLAAVFGAGAASLSGFVAAGLAASAMGQVLGFHMERLGRSIAGIFRPEIDKLVELVRRAVDWFHSLSQRQLEQIALWGKLAVGTLAVSTILPRVVAGLQAVLGAVRGLFAGGAALSPVLAGIAVLLGGMAVAGFGADGPLGELAASFGRLGASLAKLAAAFAEAFGPLVDAIAGVITPVIDTLAEALRGVNGELLSQIAKWGIAAAVFTTVLGIIPRVVSAIMTIVNAVRSLNVALAIKNALSGPLGWAQLAAGVAAAAAAVGTLAALNSMPAGPEAKGKGGHRGGELARHAGALESLQARHDRLIAAAVRGTAGKSIPDQQLEELQHIRRATEGTKAGVERQRGAFTT